VDWDSLANDAEALHFIDNISCHRLNMALRVIAHRRHVPRQREPGVARAEALNGVARSEARCAKSAPGAQRHALEKSV
jgi:hypothetical protein